MSVYVIAEDGHPLMPCSEAKARHLLDAKRAKVSADIRKEAVYQTCFENPRLS